VGYGADGLLESGNKVRVRVREPYP